MLLQHLILALLWMTYCFLHSLFAAIKVKASLKKFMGQQFVYYRLYYNIFSLAGLIGILVFQVNIRTVKLYTPTVLIGIAGGIITLGGIIIMLICIKKYFFSLSGLKTLVQEEKSNHLMISGIHRYVRHPLYLGTFCFIWGMAIIFPLLSWIITAVIITGYTLVAIRLEEQKLIEEFGDAYRQYKRSVPMLIPAARNNRN